MAALIRLTVLSLASLALASCHLTGASREYGAALHRHPDGTSSAAVSIRIYPERHK